jgi:hypothetical protein
MQIIRTLLIFSLLAITFGGCTIIRGTASGPSGETWYARQGYYTGKVKGIYYCPADGTDCVEAQTVERAEYERLTSSRSPSAGQ